MCVITHFTNKHSLQNEQFRRYKDVCGGHC